MKVDFHTHILPGIDDGSPDIDHTERMLLEEESQGIRMVVATPHFYADREPLDRFVSRRAEAYRNYLSLRKANPALPELIPAAEVYYFEGIGRAEGLDPLCAAGSRVIFLEAPFDQWREEFYRDVSMLLNYQRMKVVLVHIDRFLQYQKDPSVLAQILQLNVTLQVNCERFMTMGGRRTVRKIMNFGKRTVLGSDCHNMHSRRPNMADGQKILERKFKPEVLRTFEQGEADLMGEILQEQSGI